jgi:hypothetical protein
MAQTYVYGHVFESLTAGLYPNKQEILREYIQNAYDAIVEARAKGISDANLIRVQVDGNNLFIYDEGIGMDEQGIQEYRYFGYSKKKMDEHVGFRGIGKLAGLAVAETMVVVTKKQGEAFRYTYKCEAHKMLQAVREAKRGADNIPLDQLIEKYSSIEKAPEAKDKHYTSVQLYGVRDEEGNLTDEEEIIRYLATVAPVPFNHDQFRYSKRIEERLKKHLPKYQPVNIQVNGKLIYKPFDDSQPFHKLKFYEVKINRRISAICWCLSHTEAKQIQEGLPRGLTYRCKGFAIGDEYLVRNTIFSAGRGNMVYWYVGEIHVFDTGLIPSASRTDFEDTPARKNFYEAAREAIAKPLNSEANQRSKESAQLRKEASVQKDVVKAEKRLQNLEKELEQQSVVKEQKKLLVTELQKIRQDLENKVTLIKDPEKKREVEQQVHVQFRKIEEMTKAIQKGTVLRDVEEELGLVGDAQVVYDVIMKKVTQWFTKNAPDELSSFVTSIHRALKKRK